MQKKSESMYAVFLEARTSGSVRERPPQSARAERLGASRARGSHQHATPLRKNYFGVDVCGGDDVGGAERRDQHLQHVQTHFSEVAAELHQIFLRDLQTGPPEHGLQGDPPEHGGDCGAWAWRRARHAHRELVPQQGDYCAKVCKSLQKSAQVFQKSVIRVRSSETSLSRSQRMRTCCTTPDCTFMR